MNKKVKWGIIIAIGLGLIGWGFHTFMPHENKNLLEAPQSKGNNRKRIL